MWCEKAVDSLIWDVISNDKRRKANMFVAADRKWLKAITTSHFETSLSHIFKISFNVISPIQ